MDARPFPQRRGALVVSPGACRLLGFTARAALALSVFVSAGATYSTSNFVVTAPTAEFAKQVGNLAEQYRDEIALDWLGKRLPRWFKPCPIHVKVGQIGAGGATTFCFDRGEVFGWKMNIQGSEERILDSVLPHEVSHTIFASHFRRPLPRWADEGAATLVEHESERRRQDMLLNQVINTSQRIPLKQLLGMKDYPREMQQVLTLYAEGHSLASFLVQKGGKARFLKFLDDAHQRGWDQAIAAHYGFNDTSNLEGTWNEWVVAGSPPLELAPGTKLAAADKRRTDSDAVVRLQSPDAPAPARGPASRPRPARGPAASEREGASDFPQVVSVPTSTPAAGRPEKPIPEGSRLPRPNPLTGRVAKEPVAIRTAAAPAPRFEDEPPFERDEPKFEDSAPGAPASFTRRPATGVAGVRNVELPVPEDAAEADRRSSDWSAFPQARTTTGANRRSEPSRLLSP